MIFLRHVVPTPGPVRVNDKQQNGSVVVARFLLSPLVKSNDLTFSAARGCPSLSYGSVITNLTFF